MNPPQETPKKQTRRRSDDRLAATDLIPAETPSLPNDGNGLAIGQPAAQDFARERTGPACGERRCPLRADATRAARLGRDLATALRRLKRRLRGCIRNGCQSETCPYFIQVSQQLQAAISQVLEECAPEYMGQAPDSMGKTPDNPSDSEISR
jgi:hypothetical protein